MKLFRHVYRMGRGHVFRLSLPGHRFVSAEIFETEEQAAFACDVFKSYLSMTFGLTSAALLRSLAPSAYSRLLSETGAEPGDVSALLVESCRLYLMDGGHETLTEYANAQKEIKSARR